MKVSIKGLSTNPKLMEKHRKKMSETKARLVLYDETPIVVNGRRVIDGHKRIVACEILGITEIEAQIVEW